MVVRVFTNTSFYNDIAEELRLFTNAVVLSTGNEGEADFSVLFKDWTAIASACLDGKTSAYSYSYPPQQGSKLLIKRCEKRCVKIAAFRAMRMLFATATPWGSLTGIRPTRLYRELLEDMNEAEADEMMLHRFDVSPDKLQLVKTITAVQQSVFAEQSKTDLDVYIGIPYCRTRCLYCSFASEVRSEKTDMAAYLRALKQDISAGAAMMKEGGYKLRCIYMGGGTPTVLRADELKEVLEHTLKEYGGFGREFTVEAGRPDTIDKEKLELLYALGVNRISINPQSMNPATLERIGRSHTPESIVKVFNMARDIGFRSINMDVIAGLPGENEALMEHTLEKIMALSPENFTMHTLAIKRSSRLKACIDEYPLPSGETVEKMTAMGKRAAIHMDMRPYYMYRQKYMSGNLENIGYARTDMECIYNVDMMEETTSIMAHGAGAMSKRIFGGEHRVERIPNPKDIRTYEEKMELLQKEKRELFLAADTEKK